MDVDILLKGKMDNLMQNYKGASNRNFGESLNCQCKEIYGTLFVVYDS